jgi:hypothetical protein
VHAMSITPASSRDASPRIFRSPYQQAILWKRGNLSIPKFSLQWQDPLPF